MVHLLGGLAIFLLGTELIRKGSKFFLYRKLQRLVVRFQRSKLLSLLAGFLLTLITQSSSATTVILTSLLATGGLGLVESFPMVLGSGIGTTLTVQILTLPVSKYSLLLVFAGFVLYSFFPKYSQRSFGKVLLGIGLVFFGMELMTSSAHLISTEVETFKSSPVKLLVFSILLTAAIQSSAATILLSISLLISGKLTVEECYLMVMGANVGTTITGFLSAIGKGKPSVALNLFHLFFKLCGVLVSALAMPYFHFQGVSPEEHVVLFHIFFNTATTFLLLPLLPKPKKYSPPTPSSLCSSLNNLQSCVELGVSFVKSGDYGYSKKAKELLDQTEILFYRTAYLSGASGEITMLNSELKFLHHTIKEIWEVLYKRSSPEEYTEEEKGIIVDSLSHVAEAMKKGTVPDPEEFLEREVKHYRNVLRNGRGRRANSLNLVKILYFSFLCLLSLEKVLPLCQEKTT